MRDYEIKSDLNCISIQEKLRFVQYDNGASIVVSLLENGEKVDLSDCGILAKYKRSDGQVEKRDITNIQGNIFTAVLDSDITKSIGVLKIIFQITKDDIKICTFMLSADIEENIGESDNTGGSIDVTVDLSEYYKKSETYSKEQIDSQLNNIANDLGVDENGDVIALETTAQTVRGAINELKNNSQGGSSTTGMTNKLYGVKIGVLGDSVSMGGYHCYGDENATVKTWHEIIANNVGCVINNVSRGGSTLTTVKDDGYSFIDRSNNLDSDCNIILIFGGINDYTWAGGTELGTLGDTDTANICGALKTLCEGLINKYPAKPIGFILPYGFNEYKGSGTWLPFENKIIEMLNYYGIPFINLRTDSIMNANIDFINAKYFRYSSEDSTTGDKTHPNTTGHRIIAKAILSFIEKIYNNLGDSSIAVEILPTGISLRETLELTKDEESTLAVTFVPSTTTDKTVTWKSSDTNIATVSDTGIVKAIAEGNCTITATTSNGKTATCNITVGTNSSSGYVTDGLTNFWNPVGQEQQVTSWSDEVSNSVATISGLDYTEEGFEGNKLKLRATLSATKDESSLAVPFTITDNCTFEIALKYNTLSNNTYKISDILEIYESNSLGLRVSLKGEAKKVYSQDKYQNAGLGSIAIVKNGSNINMVVNGVTQKTFTDDTSSGNVEFVSANNSWAACNDDIYSIKVYNRALSDAELLQNYEYYKTLVG